VVSHKNSIYNENGNNHVKSDSSGPYSSILRKIDSLDMKIMSLMVSGTSNKEMASRLKVPLSTIQRRGRKLIQKGVVNYKAEVNLQLKGFKRGLVHIYINDGNMDQLARRISTLVPMESVEVHIGNSDMIGKIIYKDSKHLLRALSEIKKLDGVAKIVWSEEVYTLQNNNNKISKLMTFKR
jgi:Lrp/AsnC family transcriptional regulator for asnA, asnC and gidA